MSPAFASASSLRFLEFAPCPQYRIPFVRRASFFSRTSGAVHLFSTWRAVGASSRIDTDGLIGSASIFRFLLAPTARNGPCKTAGEAFDCRNCLEVRTLDPDSTCAVPVGLLVPVAAIRTSVAPRAFVCGRMSPSLTRKPSRCGQAAAWMPSHPAPYRIDLGYAPAVGRTRSPLERHTFPAHH